MRVKGLLEMMFEVLSDWIETFIHDIEGLEAAEGMSAPLTFPSSSLDSTTPPPSSNTSPRGSHHLHSASGRPF